jgi:hypothetical protein
MARAAPNQCEMCGASFPNEGSLQSHQNMAHYPHMQGPEPRAGPPLQEHHWLNTGAQPPEENVDTDRSRASAESDDDTDDADIADRPESNPDPSRQRRARGGKDARRSSSPQEY